jgi:ADP-ribose pyrophosphatase YjhB (NUDIX family)
VEVGERVDESLMREIKEESNMKVLDFKPLGYQIVTDEEGEDEPYYQLRYYCKVEPYGPFESDPDGDVTEVLEIDPDDYKKYFDWGEIGDALMNKALKIKNNIN